MTMLTLTPDEARRQTCPLIRYCENYDAVIQGGAPAIYIHQNCTGPACKIGWRWETDGSTPHDRGYCGAFGKP
jgi:hypothetical protein